MIEEYKKFKLTREDNTSVLKTIRIKTETLDKIEELSIKTNISINRIINACILYALENMEEDEEEDKKN